MKKSRVSSPLLCLVAFIWIVACCGIASGDDNVPAEELILGDIPAEELTPGDIPTDEPTPGDVPAEELTPGDVPTDEPTPDNVPTETPGTLNAIELHITGNGQFNMYGYVPEDVDVDDLNYIRFGSDSTVAGHSIIELNGDTIVVGANDDATAVLDCSRISAWADVNLYNVAEVGTVHLKMTGDGASEYGLLIDGVIISELYITERGSQEVVITNSEIGNLYMDYRGEGIRVPATVIVEDSWINGEYYDYLEIN